MTDLFLTRFTEDVVEFSTVVEGYRRPVTVLRHDRTPDASCDARVPARPLGRRPVARKRRLDRVAKLRAYEEITRLNTYLRAAA